MSSNQKWRSSREYRVWRILVIRRDKVCQICGERKARHSHHVDSASYFPKLRFDVDNGVCLCGNCHRQYHTSFNRSYRVKTTRYDFENFVSLMEYAKTIEWR
jgi:predicted restriction endonuclease